MHSTAKLKFECESTVLNSGFLKRKILVESNLRGHGSQHESPNWPLHCTLFHIQ